jgi:hypothetical protein
MEQINTFFYLMGVFAIGVISISKYNGSLEIIPNNVFWVLYIPMLILLITSPLVRKYGKNNLNQQGKL